MMGNSGHRCELTHLLTVLPYTAFPTNITLPSHQSTNPHFHGSVQDNTQTWVSNLRYISALDWAWQGTMLAEFRGRVSCRGGGGGQRDIGAVTCDRVFLRSHGSVSPLSM